jgi:hypothetical protein
MINWSPSGSHAAHPSAVAAVVAALALTCSALTLTAVTAPRVAVTSVITSGPRKPAANLQLPSAGSTHCSARWFCLVQGLAKQAC